MEREESVTSEPTASADQTERTAAGTAKREAEEAVRMTGR
jgi:hypothetical protein